MDKKKVYFTAFLLIVSFVIGSAVTSEAKQKEDLDSLRIQEKEQRSNSLEFEGGVVEGADKGRGNYATVTKEKKRRNDALYKRFMSFDMDETIREMRYAQ